MNVIAIEKPVQYAVVLEGEKVQIPGWVADLESFRAWMHQGTTPDKLRACYLKGLVWVDMSKEQIFSHGQVKQEVAHVIGGFVKAQKLGLYLPDGTLITSEVAKISVQPDGAFVSHDALRQGRVRLIKGAHGGFVEVEGAPDMVLEVVSQSSEQKDTKLLFRAYWEAGIPEYWIVDARKAPIKFNIFRSSSKGYVAEFKKRGWLKSTVFGRSFQLQQVFDASGLPEYTLSMR